MYLTITSFNDSTGSPNMSPCGFPQHQVPGRSAPAMLPYKPGPAGQGQGLTGPVVSHHCDQWWYVVMKSELWFVEFFSHAVYVLRLHLAPTLTHISSEGTTTQRCPIADPSNKNPDLGSFPWRSNTQPVGHSKALATPVPGQLNKATVDGNWYLCYL